jgi:PIN domain nuclease of toxin-antitoxin system
MLSGIADTHAIIWYLFGDRRLSPAAKTFLEKAATGENQVGLSSITLAEIIYLTEKKRIPPGTLTRLTGALDMPGSLLAVVPFDRQIAEALPRVERLKVPELPDRIIAATALCLGIPLVSRDAKIQTSGIETVW